MSKTTAEVHEANNTVIAIAKAAAAELGVDMVIAVCGMSADGSTVTIGVDSHGERELMLGACAGGAALKRAADVDDCNKLYVHWAAVGHSAAGSMFDRNVVRFGADAEESK